jgi:hypothetical protein
MVIQRCRSTNHPARGCDSDNNNRLIAMRLNYFVSLFDVEGRELNTLVVQSSHDMWVVTWARILVAQRIYASARVERKGSSLRRSALSNTRTDAP